MFGVATECGVIKLYDVRFYDKGPFDQFTVGGVGGWVGACPCGQVVTGRTLALSCVAFASWVCRSPTGSV